MSVVLVVSPIVTFAWKYYLVLFVGQGTFFILEINTALFTFGALKMMRGCE